MLLGRFWQSLEKGGGKWVGKGGVKGKLPGATALKTDKKKKQERRRYQIIIVNEQMN